MSSAAGVCCLQAMSYVITTRAATGQSKPVTEDEAQQLTQIVTAAEAELQSLPFATVEAAQALASCRNGRLRAPWRSSALLEGREQHATSAQPELSPREVPMQRTQGLQRSRAATDASDPLQLVLAAEAGLGRLHGPEASCADADGPESSRHFGDAPAEHCQAVSASPSPQPGFVTAAVHSGLPGMGDVQAAHVAKRLQIEAARYGPSDVPDDYVPAAAPEGAMSAPAWQQPSADSRRTAIAEASDESSQWSDSESDTSCSSAWSDMSADWQAGAAHRVAAWSVSPLQQMAAMGASAHAQKGHQPRALAAVLRPSAPATVRSRPADGPADRETGVPRGNVEQPPERSAAVSLPLTQASLQQLLHPEDGSPSKAGRPRASSATSLWVEAISEQGLSSDDEDAQPSRLLPPGLLVAGATARGCCFAVAGDSVPVTAGFSIAAARSIIFSWTHQRQLSVISCGADAATLQTSGPSRRAVAGE